MQRFLANLVQCLDLSETKTEKLNAALRNPNGDALSFATSITENSDSRLSLPWPGIMQATFWRAFLLVNYLPYVADMSAYCPNPGTLSQPTNSWTTLRSGAGYPPAVRFAQSLTKEHFEAATLAHEILAAMEDYPDVLAFRWKSSPMSPLLIPSSEEALQRILGFLDIREGASREDWSTFLTDTIAEDIPWWGFDAVATVIKLAAKAAKLALIEGHLAEWSGASAHRKLDAIESQTDAIHGAQRPMWELQEDTKRAVDQVAKQQNDQADLLQRIGRQLSRPGPRHAEANLKHILGESTFRSLTDEAKTAAVEGELRFLQSEYSDPSVIPFQFAKAFECQLRAKILDPFSQTHRTTTDHQYKLRDIERMLEQSDRDFIAFLKNAGFDFRLLHQKLNKLIPIRNQAAHYAVISPQRAFVLRDDWLGISRSGDSIFAALVPKNASGLGRTNGPT